MRFAATAFLVCLLAAPALTQSPPIAPADRQLIMQFGSAEEADRVAMIASQPRVTDPAFLEALANAGNLQKDNNNLDTAEACYRALLFIGERQRLPRTIAIAYNDLGILSGMRGDLPEATAFLQHAMDISEQSGDLKGIQSAWANLGIAQRRMGE